MLFHVSPTALPEGYGDALLPLAACKAHLGLPAEADEFDGLIEALRDAAIDGVEQYANLYLGRRTGLEAVFSGFGPGMRLGRGPVGSLAITTVAYLDGDSSPVSLVTGGWRLGVDDGLLPAIGTAWPVSHGPVTVTFDAGYPAGACPAGLLLAAKMFVAFLFANREALASDGLTGDLPGGVIWWCDRYRMPVI